jgi:hypothetical protein
MPTFEKIEPGFWQDYTSAGVAESDYFARYWHLFTCQKLQQENIYNRSSRIVTHETDTVVNRQEIRESFAIVEC